MTSWAVGEGTWGYSRDLLQEALGFVPFEFCSDTAARFQDVARDLADAINTIHRETGKPVHLIAHSFGGLLVRTLLQNWGELHFDEDPVRAIASVTTLGRRIPALPTTNRWHDVPLPAGQEYIRQRRLVQELRATELPTGGRRYRVHFCAGSRFYVSAEAGELVAGLADVSTPPNTRMLVLMGLTTRRGENDVVDPGDGLITYEGQRFLPSDSIEDSNGGCDIGDIEALSWKPLRGAQRVHEAVITERMLGLADTIRPNDPSPDGHDGGYKHSDGVDGAGFAESDRPAEPLVLCDEWQTCSHDSFVEVLDWILTQTPPPPEDQLINDGLISGSISAPGEIDEFTFNANAGEAVHIRVVDINGDSFYPKIWLYNPDGTLNRTDLDGRRRSWTAIRRPASAGWSRPAPTGWW